MVVVVALLMYIGSVGFGKAEDPPAVVAHGGTLGLVSLEGLGLEAVLDRQAVGGWRGWHSDRSRPMLQAS